MSKRHLVLVPLLALLASACTSAAPAICGESFCLPKDAKLVSRESPVEDFNVYQVEAVGSRFVIYEGNYPQRSPGSVLISVGKDWPNYLEISGPCASENDCAVKAFTSKIVVR